MRYKKYTTSNAHKAEQRRQHGWVSEDNFFTLYVSSRRSAARIALDIFSCVSAQFGNDDFVAPWLLSLHKFIRAEGFCHVPTQDGCKGAQALEKGANAAKLQQ